MPRFLSVLCFGALVLDSLCGAPAAPAHGEWHSTRLGGGGYILNIYQAPSAPEVFYTHIDVGGIYRSDDGAKTWRMLHGAFPPTPGITETAGLTVDPRDADTVLAAVGSEWFPPLGLFRTEDGGRTWAQVLAARFYGNGPFRSEGQPIARSPHDPDLLAAAGAGGVFLSRDGGRTWRPAGLETVNAVHVQFHPRHPNRLWVCARPNKFHNDPATFEGGFYLSPDLGLSWEKLADAAPSELVARPDADELVGIFNYNEIRLSRDDGRTWASYNEGLPYAAVKNHEWYYTPDRTNALALGPDFWLTASGVGEFFRRDFGAAAWTAIQRETLTEVAYGQPWWGRALPGHRRHHGAALGAIWIDPADPARWISTDWYGLWTTGDAGKNWRLSLDGIEDTCVHALVQDPAVEGRLHVGLWDLGYVSSDDAGASAHRERGGEVTANFKAIAVSARDPRELYATGDGNPSGWHANSIWRSHDAGATWRRLVAPPGLPPPETGARYNSVVIHPDDPARAYVAVSGPVGDARAGVFRTRDGGASWAPLNTGLPADAPFFRADVAHHGPELAVQKDGTLLAISCDHGPVYRLARDASAWTPVVFSEAEALGKPRCVLPDPHAPGRFYLSFDAGGVQRSDDAGASWTPVFTREGTWRLAVDARVPGRLAASTLTGVWVSLDAAASWRDYGAGLPHRWYPVPVFSGEHLVVGTIGSGLFWRELEPQPLTAPSVMPRTKSRIVQAKRNTTGTLANV